MIVLRRVLAEEAAVATALEVVMSREDRVVAIARLVAAREASEEAAHDRAAREARRAWVRAVVVAAVGFQAAAVAGAAVAVAVAVVVAVEAGDRRSDALFVIPRFLFDRRNHIAFLRERTS